jgi:hypothetical protein
MMGKQKRPKQTAQPRWQPISMLAPFAIHIDGMLEADLEQYENLSQAREKPHMLDDYTVNRVKQVFGKQQQDFHLFEEQLSRWQSGELTDGQRAEVTRLQGQMAKLRENNTNVLALADELSKGTIDKIMGKSDAGLGIEYLMRTMEGK